MSQPQGFDIDSDWHWRPYNLFTPYVVAPGGRRDLCIVRGKGYGVLGGVTATSPLITAHVEFETKKGDIFMEEFSIATLIAGNLILPMSAGWFVTQIAPLIPAFSCMFAPACWWPFSNRFSVSLLNPSPLPITCVSSILTIVLENQK